MLHRMYLRMFLTLSFLFYLTLIYVTERSGVTRFPIPHSGRPLPHKKKEPAQAESHAGQ